MAKKRNKDFSYTIGEDSYDTSNPEDMKASGKRQQLGKNFGQSTDFFTSAPKQNRMLDQKLGPAQNPLQGIIQGMMFRNTNPGRTLRDNKARDIRFGSPMMDFGREPVLTNPKRGGTEMLPDFSNFMRSFIYSMMQRKR